jgi:hypothetical protein
MIVLRLVVHKNLSSSDCHLEKANDFLICHRSHNKPSKCNARKLNQ